MHAEEFHRVVNAARLPNPGGINQNIFLRDRRAAVLGRDFHFKRHIHGIARGAGDGRDDDALGVGERVDDGGLADVGAADDGELIVGGERWRQGAETEGS